MDETTGPAQDSERQAGKPAPQPKRRFLNWKTLLILLLALPLLAFYLGPYFIPESFLRNRIEAALEGELNREVTVETVSVRTWSGIRVRMGGVRVAGEGADTPPMALLGTLDVHLALLPLLSGEPELRGTVRFRGGEGNLSHPDFPSPVELSGIDGDFILHRVVPPPQGAGPVEILKRLDYTGKIRAASISLPGARLEEGTCELVGTPDRMTVNGEINAPPDGTIRLEYAGEWPKEILQHDVSLRVDRFEVDDVVNRKLLVPFLHETAKLVHGEVGLRADLKGEGLDPDRLIRESTGSLYASVGRFRLGLHPQFQAFMEEMWPQISALLSEVMTPEELQTILDRINEAAAPARLRVESESQPGVLMTDVFLEAETHNIHLRGRIGKEDGSLQLPIDATSFSDERLKEFWTRYVGGEHLITGTVFEPQLNPFALFNKVSQNIAKREIGERLEKGKDRLEEKIGKEIERGLDKIFKE